MATALAGAVVAGYAAPASASRHCDGAVDTNCHIYHCSYNHCWVQLCVLYVAPTCVV